MIGHSGVQSVSAVCGRPPWLFVCTIQWEFV